MRARVIVEFDNPEVTVRATTGSIDWKTCGESIGRCVQVAVDATRVDLIEQLDMLRTPAQLKPKRGPGRPRKTDVDKATQ